MEMTDEPDIESETDETQNETFIVHEDRKGQRLDAWAAAVIPGLSRAEAQRLIEHEALLVNGSPARSSYHVRLADSIVLSRRAPAPAAVQPESIPLRIVYEDHHLLVINKARGMVVHPAPGSLTGTLVNAVLAHASDLSGIGGEVRPGIVHRLDKDTGGLIVVAKTDAAHRSLQQQIQNRTAVRRYTALLWGVPQFERATVDASIGRHPTDRKKMAVITDPAHASRRAVTELQVIESLAGIFSICEARLETGRTHQIRVHCAYIRHPVVGDMVYGGVRKVPARGLPPDQAAILEAAIGALGGQALHAERLSFQHPVTDERMDFYAEPDPEILEVIRLARGLQAA